MNARALKIEQKAQSISEISQLKPRKYGRGKRSTADMLAECDSPLEEASYAFGRIESYEDGIINLLKLLSKEAREIVLARRPSLKRYV